MQAMYALSHVLQLLLRLLLRSSEKEQKTRNEINVCAMFVIILLCKTIYMTKEVTDNLKKWVKKSFSTLLGHMPEFLQSSLGWTKRPVTVKGKMTLRLVPTRHPVMGVSMI